MAATTIEVRGDELTIDPAVMETWAAFKLLRDLDTADDAFAKADATFRLAELVSGLTESDIAERCGGDQADACAVVEYALEIIKAATPKN